ncbi:piwi-like protein Siwi isoform X1 [Rhynchophorus ferrugineus]|uniref:piwi-like protein Siwi isoform X1 n=1 Tax=Rhynchophorus ferrugineus TaxID=354439 RepID=UPI003FCE3389
MTFYWNQNDRNTMKEFQQPVIGNNQPMLLSRSKPRKIRVGMPEIVMLMPQLCTMTGLTEKQREKFQLMKSLSEHTLIGSIVTTSAVILLTKGKVSPEWWPPSTWVASTANTSRRGMVYMQNA